MIRTLLTEIACLLFAASGIAFAQEGSTAGGDQAPVARAREALRDAGDFPWYNAEADEFRRIDVAPERGEDDNRKSRWEGGRYSGPTITPPGLFSGLANVLVWTLVILLIVILVGVVLWAFLKMEGRRAAASATGESTEQESLGEADRIENLPFRVARPQSDLLAEARRLYEAGHFSEAVIYLFSYQLVQLDRHQLIRLTKGKTNRQYLREIRPRPELRTILERTMIAFEDVFFGRRELERERFMTCWTQLDAFHQQLQTNTI